MCIGLTVSNKIRCCKQVEPNSLVPPQLVAVHAEYGLLAFGDFCC